jgi:cytochrome c1
MDSLRAAALLLLAISIMLAGCTGGKVTRPYTVAVNGNPEDGKQLIQSFGCGSCHTIPGIYTAQGVVGPPLMFFARRTMIAGELPNSPENLVRWIENPPAVEPKTAMPNLGVTDEQAHDIASYLYTLR